MRTLKSAISTIVFIGLSTLSFISCSDTDEEFFEEAKQEQRLSVPDVPYEQTFYRVSCIGPDSTALTLYSHGAWDYTYHSSSPTVCSKLELGRVISNTRGYIELDSQAIYHNATIEVYRFYPRGTGYELESSLRHKYPYKDRVTHSTDECFVSLALDDFSHYYHIQWHYEVIELSLVLHTGNTELSGQAILDTINELSARLYADTSNI